MARWGVCIIVRSLERGILVLRGLGSDPSVVWTVSSLHVFISRLWLQRFFFFSFFSFLFFNFNFNF